MLLHIRKSQIFFNGYFDRLEKNIYVEIKLKIYA